MAAKHRQRSNDGEGRDEKPGASRKEERRAEASVRRRESEAKKPFEKKFASIEKELESLTREARETEAWLATAEAYEEGHKERLQLALKRRGELSERITRLEDDWLWAQAEMERHLAKTKEV